MNHWFDSRKF